MDIEQLKLIVEMLKGLSGEVLTGAVIYMVLGFLQAPIIWAMIVWGAVKIVGKLTGDHQNVIKVKDIESKE